MHKTLTGDETLAQLRVMRKDALERAQAITDGLKAKDGSATPDAATEAEFKSSIDLINEIDARVQELKAALESTGMPADTPGKALMHRAALMDNTRKLDAYRKGLPIEGIDVYGNVTTVGGGQTKGHLTLTKRSGTAAKIAGAMVGRKDLSTPAGTYLASILVDGDAKRLGSAPIGLAEAVPAISRGAVSRYLRQTARTGGADIVAPGGLKPTLGIKLDPIDSELEVIAVVSEPLDKFVLEDYVAATSFVEVELTDAIKLRIEQLILNTFATTSGIANQPWDTAGLFATLRKGRLLAENLGYQPNTLALHPSDWAAVELTTDGQERFQLEPGGVPVDLAKKQVWGLEVVTSTKVTVGEGWVFDSVDGLAIGTDGRLSVDWDTAGDLFTHNQVRARAETRASVELYQPGSIVKVDLTA